MLCYATALALGGHVEPDMEAEMARLEVRGESLVMALGLLDRIWGFWGRVPKVKRSEIFDIYRVEHVWTDVLDLEYGKSSGAIRSVMVDIMDDARGSGAGRLFLTTPRCWDSQGKVAVSVFRNGEGLVVVMKPGAQWSMFIVSDKGSSEALPSLRRKVLFEP